MAPPYNAKAGSLWSCHSSYAWHILFDVHVHVAWIFLFGSNCSTAEWLGLLGQLRLFIVLEVIFGKLQRLRSWFHHGSGLNKLVNG